MNNSPYVGVKFLTEFLSMVALCVFRLERRKGFWLRLPACLLLCYALSWFTSPVFMQYYGWNLDNHFFNVLRYTAIFLCLVVSVQMCIAVDVKEAVFICSGSYAIQHLVLKVQNFVEELYISFAPRPVVVVLYLAFVLGCYALFYFVMIRNVQWGDDLRLKSSDTFRLNLLIIVCLVMLSVFSGDLTVETVFGRLALTGYGVMCSIFLLCMQSDVYTRSALEKENEQIEYILAQEQKRFESFRAESEYLDIKCHDLKHQIHKLKEQPAVSHEAIEEMEAGIAAYESYARTGCPALDIMLGEKYLQCANHGIQFAVSVASEKLNRLSEPDIYSLFGNALDNAIEYETALPAGKRFIRLSVKDIANMMLIRVENCYEGPPVADGSELRTTKKDKLYHGFGLKSMRHIAAKYGGEMEIETHDGVFCLTFVFTMA